MIRRGDGRSVGHREFGTAELAAGHLLILLRADGYEGDSGDTLSRLIAGETVTHERFTYQVVEEAP